MRITRWLPSEVLTEIIHNAPRADQATLCRVSKLFHALALPNLNRRVVIRPGKLSLQALEAFPLSMIRNPARADSVRSLTFLENGSLNHDSLHAQALLIECLKLMRKLEHFCIRDFRPLGVGSYLADLDFPNLWSCTLECHAESWELNIARFLTRHPTITHFRLYMWIGIHGRHDPLPQGTLLPRLQYYHGPLHLLCGFSKHSLVAVQTSWTGHTPSLIPELGAQTGPNLASLSIDYIRMAQISDVIIFLSKHMWQLQKLQLRCWQWMLGIASDINACLPRFKHLTYLAFSTSDESDDAVGNWDNERRAFEMWTNTSSSLRGCGIGQTACRKVDQKWEDCSKEAFYSEAGFAVFDSLLTIDDD
ncbi:hypothetical protein FB45DRAFT_931257, partial [Roridomyces roridus]